jgi:ribosomal protein S12 methylthiotransferase accessory factor
MDRRDLFVHLVHDGNALASIRNLESLDVLRDTLLSEQVTIDQEADLVVAHASGQSWHAMLLVQEQARLHGRPILFVTVEPGSAWIGPLLRPNASGCLLCLKSRLANNHRDTHRWYNTESDAVQRRNALGPVAPAAVAAFQTILGEVLVAYREDRQGHGLECGAVRLDLDTLTSRRHRFVPQAHCPACSRLPHDAPDLARQALRPRLKTRVDDDRIPNPALTVDALRRDYVDRRSGLIRHVFHDLTSRLMPMFAAEMPLANSQTVEVGYGRSDTRQGSEMVALLESLERYAGHAPRGKLTSVRGSYAQVRDQAMDPRSFIMHAAGQAAEPGYSLRQYDDQLVFNWVWGYSLREQRPILVPEQLVYYWLPELPERPVNRFLFDTSSGCAMGGCIEEAMLYGLLEVVERDAYLATWYNRYTPVEVNLESIRDAQIQALLARAHAEGFELHVFDIRHDIDVPVFWAMIVDPRDDAAVKSYCAAGAHLRPERAIYAALVEVITSMGVYQRTLPLRRALAHDMLQNHSLVQRMSDHVLLYSLPESYSRLEFLCGGRKADVSELFPDHVRKRSRDLTEELRAQVGKVLGVALDVIVVDQTFPALRNSGLSCAKILAPGLLPITFGHQYRRISLDRLRAAARATGRQHLPELADLNPYPHNFP